MPSWGGPHDGQCRILQSRPFVAGNRGTSGYPDRLEDHLSVFEFVRTFERNLGGVKAAAGWNRWRDIAGASDRDRTGEG